MSLEFSVFFLFVLLPSFKGKINTIKYRGFKGAYTILNLDNVGYLSTHI